jgi:hypothetical protein
VSAPPPGLLAPDESATRLTHNTLNQATGGIWRVAGASGTRILKIATPGRPDGAQHWPTSTDPGHWNYWRREPLAYRDSLPASAYPGVAAPGLLGCDELPDGSVALWLEDIAGLPGFDWDARQLREFARRLGAGQARWLGGEPLSREWLSRDWLRDYAGSRPVPGPVPWEHPLLAAWPERLHAGVDELWARRDELFDLAVRMPQTLCHHDVWPMNLIWSAAGPTLLDWSFVGPGAIGEDAANMIVDSVADGHVDVARLPEIEATVLDGYQAGLDEAGAGLDPALVRRAVAATGAAKYCWLIPRGQTRVTGTGGPGSYDAGGGPAAIAQRWRPLAELLVRWTGEALG